MRGRIDANQREITLALRKAGASVMVLSEVGHGCPDLIVGYKGVNILLECKDGRKPPSARKLTPEQVRFHHFWQGPVKVVSSSDEAISVLQGQDAARS